MTGRFAAMTPVLLIGAGPVEPDAAAIAAPRAGAVVAADGGAAGALSLGLRPDLVVGDLDSLDDATRAALGSAPVVHDRDQDTTDFEKCLARIDAPLILALGVTGGRIDHTLAAMTALAGPLGGRCIVVTGEDVVFAARPGLVLPLAPGTRVSLYPMGAVEGRSEGLEWPIDGLALSPAGRVATSNRATGTVRIEAGGPLLVILPLACLTTAMDALWPRDAQAR